MLYLNLERAALPAQQRKRRPPVPVESQGSLQLGQAGRLREGRMTNERRTRKDDDHRSIPAAVDSTLPQPIEDEVRKARDGWTNALDEAVRMRAQGERIHWRNMALVEEVDRLRAELAVTQAPPLSGLGLDLLEMLKMPALLESLAAIEHERWAGWMRYQETAPSQKRADWPRKAALSYWGLTDAERESDRIEVRKTLAAIRAFAETKLAARRPRDAIPPFLPIDERAMAGFSLEDWHEAMREIKRLRAELAAARCSPGPPPQLPPAGPGLTPDEIGGPHDNLAGCAEAGSSLPSTTAGGRTIITASRIKSAAFAAGQAACGHTSDPLTEPECRRLQEAILLAVAKAVVVMKDGTISAAAADFTDVVAKLAEIIARRVAAPPATLPLSDADVERLAAIAGAAYGPPVGPNFASPFLAVVRAVIGALAAQIPLLTQGPQEFHVPHYVPETV